MSMEYEALNCASCGIVFARLIQRGRKPSQCPTCRSAPVVGFLKTDGGATASGFSKENNDCTVRALSIGFGLPYAEVHGALEKLGRKPGKKTGVHMSYMFAAVAQGKAEIIQTKGCNTVFSTITTLGKTGTYIIQIRQHVFAVKNGVIMDTWKPGKKCRTRMVWRVLDTGGGKA